MTFCSSDRAALVGLIVELFVTNSHVTGNGLQAVRC